eukprot:gene61583-84229_t
MRALSKWGGGACLFVGTMLCGATPAAAQLHALVDPPASADAAKQGVEVFLLNEGSAAQPAQGPAELEVVARDGARLRLVAAPDGEGPVAPGAFARVHYRLAAAAPTSAPVTVADVAPGATEQPSRTSRGTTSAFLDRLHPYATPRVRPPASRRRSAG